MMRSSMFDLLVGRAEQIDKKKWKSMSCGKELLIQEEALTFV